MGYFTTYSLTWEAQKSFKHTPNCPHKEAEGHGYCPVCGKPVGTNGSDEQVAAVILSDREKFYALEADGSSSDSVKWYEHEEVMRKMSKDVRGLLFKLHGEGEETGDIWDKYFLNGKMQICKAQVVIPTFDEKLLK